MNNSPLATKLAALTFEQFVRFYETTGKVQAGMAIKCPRKSLNDKQLKTAYETHIRKLKQYVDKMNKAEEEKEPSADQETREICMKRDGGVCRLLLTLSTQEKEEFDRHANYLRLKIDAAHIFGKNAYPKLRFNPDNIVMMNRVSHNWIDAGKSPVNGKPITAAEKEQWWKRIVGADRYERLTKLISEERYEGSE